MNSESIVKFFSSKKGFFIYILLLFVLTLLSFGKSLNFHFYRDDWTQFWYALNYPEYFLSKSTAIIMHPGAAIEEFIGLKIFGMNPLLWQFWGLTIRVFGSLSFALMIFAMTRSKYAAYLSGLLYAPSAIGLESIVGVSAHTSPFIVFFFGLGFYFWIISGDAFLSKTKILSILFLFISVWISPIRVLPLLILILLWDITGLWIKDKRTKSHPTKVLGKLGNFIFLSPLFFRIYKYSLAFGFSFGQNPFIAKDNLAYLKPFFTSLGSLSLGWLIPFRESISQSESSIVLYMGGVVFLILFIYTTLLFCYRRKEKYRLYFLFLTLMLISYLPNWLAARYMMLGVSHRYFALSGIGLVGIVAVFISGLKIKAQRTLVIVFILANIINSNRILFKQDSYRSYKKTEAVIERLDKDVVPEQKNLIFLFQGGQLRAEIFDMSGVPMFSFKRNITKEEDVPIATGDIELIKNLLCKGNVNRPALHHWIVQKSKIPLSHVYAWHIDNKGVLTNVSERERENIKKQLNCNYLE